MNEELNNLVYDNTKVTFSNVTNNLALSDELEAAPLYQNQMGTRYSKSKMAIRVFNFTGISLILTAAAIKTGNIISNAYILNPPSIKDDNYRIEGHVFQADFTVSNPRNYKVEYYLTITRNEETIEVIREECSEEKSYSFTYEQLINNDQGHFYISFTNKVDYKLVIKDYSFKVTED